jgi:DNA-binding YbaB/EbfC family protein
MAKGKGKGMRLPKGMGGGMAQQLQKLQQEMLETQEALGDEVVEVTAGGGAIRIAITGHQRVQSITIDPEVVDPEDVEMLQDLVVAAVNEAIEKSQNMASERLSDLTGGLGIPGLS